MQPEGEIALSVQVCKGIFEKGFLAVFIEVGMKEDVDEQTEQPEQTEPQPEPDNQ